jgi:FAD dependent oxidoreductase
MDVLCGCADRARQRKRRSSGGHAMADFDLAVIGGGITGTGIARNAAGRGLRVLLVEPHDLSAGTSSASSKVFHSSLTNFKPTMAWRRRQAQYESAILRRIAPTWSGRCGFYCPIIRRCVHRGACGLACSSSIVWRDRRSCLGHGSLISPTERSPRRFSAAIGLGSHAAVTRSTTVDSWFSMRSMLQNAGR